MTVDASISPSAGTGSIQSEEPMLRISGLTKRFRDFPALTNVDLSVKRGEFLTLLGPSGCGKTTLLRIIAGFEKESEGRLDLHGRDLGHVPPERRPFNMVFQSYALFPHMTVFQNVAYGPETARMAPADIVSRVGEVVEIVGLKKLASRNVRELSGGQQQRVALARALVNDPDLLLLDEPLGALDLQIRKRMQDELRRIQTTLGTTFIYVTHDQGEALALSHRIALMNEGQLVQVGSPREVYDRPVNVFAAKFVGEANLLPATVETNRSDLATVLLGSNRLEIPYYGRRQLVDSEQVWVALRPEHLELCDAAIGMFSGALDDAVFLGDSMRYDVRIDSGEVLHVRSQTGTTSQAGGRVGVTVRRGCGVVVTSD